MHTQPPAHALEALELREAGKVRAPAPSPQTPSAPRLPGKRGSRDSPVRPSALRPGCSHQVERQRVPAAAAPAGAAAPLLPPPPASLLQPPRPGLLRGQLDSIKRVWGGDRGGAELSSATHDPPPAPRSRQRPSTAGELQMGHFLPHPGSPALAQADRQTGQTGLSCSTAPPEQQAGGLPPF